MQVYWGFGEFGCPLYRATHRKEQLIVIAICHCVSVVNCMHDQYDH